MGDKTFEKPHAVGGQVHLMVRLSFRLPSVSLQKSESEEEYFCIEI